LEIAMLKRLFKLFGYRTGDQIMDFIMVGVVVIPIMLLVDDQEDAAALAMAFALPAILLGGAWTHGLRAVEDDEARRRAEFRRRISGRD